MARPVKVSLFDDKCLLQLKGKLESENLYSLLLGAKLGIQVLYGHVRS